MGSGFLQGQAVSLPCHSWGHGQMHQGQESPPPAGRFSGNVRNALTQGQLQRAISGNMRVLRALTPARRSQAPCTCHPGMLLVLAAPQRVTSSLPVAPSRAVAAPLRAHVGAVDWRLPLPGAGGQGAWASGVGSGESRGGPPGVGWGGEEAFV